MWMRSASAQSEAIDDDDDDACECSESTQLFLHVANGCASVHAPRHDARAAHGHGAHAKNRQPCGCARQIEPLTWHTLHHAHFVARIDNVFCLGVKDKEKQRFHGLTHRLVVTGSRLFNAVVTTRSRLASSIHACCKHIVCAMSRQSARVQLLR